MAAGADKENPEQKSGGKGGLLTLIVTALVSAAVAAGVSFLALSKLSETTAMPPAEAAQQAPQTSAEAAASFRERLYTLEPLVVNVNGEGYSRFLKIKIELECESPEVSSELEQRLPQVRDAALTLVSSKRLEDVADFEGKALLKEDLRQRLNQILQSGDVKSVLFTEFVVQ